MRIAEVRVADHLAEIEPLLRENWAETGFGFDLDVDAGRYVQLQDAGVLIALAAFDAGEIVGYSTAAVTPHHFNPRIVICASDALFVRKDYRRTTVAARLILATEAAGKERGANRMLWHTRAGTPFAQTLERRGYIPVDVVVMKEV